MRGRLRLLLPAIAVCVGLDALAARLLGWSFERAVLLSPVVVVAAGAAAFLIVLWTRVAWESLRGARRR